MRAGEHTMATHFRVKKRLIKRHWLLEIRSSESRVYSPYPKKLTLGFTKSSFIVEDMCLFGKSFPFLSQTCVLIFFHLIWPLLLVTTQETFAGLQDVPWTHLQHVFSIIIFRLASRFGDKQNVYWKYLHLKNLYLTNLYLTNLYLTNLRRIQEAFPIISIFISFRNSSCISILEIKNFINCLVWWDQLN